jgi:hypothetical protein
MQKGLIMSVCPNGSTREPLDGFGLNWHGRYAIAVNLKIVLFNLLQWVIPTWRRNKLVKWDRH